MSKKWRAWTEEEKQEYIQRVLDKESRGEQLKDSESEALRVYKRTGKVDQRTVELFELYAD